MVSYDRNLGVWRVNGAGAYGSRAEAEAAAAGSAPAARNDTGAFQGGPSALPASQVAAPQTQANPANDRARAEAELRRSSAVAGYHGTANTGHASGGTGGVGALAGYEAGSQATRDAYNATHVSSRNGFLPAAGRVALAAVNPVGTAAALGAKALGAGRPVQTLANIGAGGPTAATTVAATGTANAINGPGPNTRDTSRSGGTAGASQPGGPTNTAPMPTPPAAPVDPNAGTPAPGANAPQTWQPVQQDYSRYDAEAERLRQLQTTFLDQLQRLSGSDPFGNQAALQKATDRAVSQAAGTAVGGRGGAAALAGAQRQAVGVQAQTAARGAQDIVEQRRRDEQTATGLGLQAIGGAADIGKQLSANEIAMGDQAIKAAEVNLRGYLGGQELGQRERESLRNFALEASKIDQARYATDMEYRARVDADLTQRYIAGTQLEAVYAKIKADQDISPKDWLMGAVGLASGVAGAFSITSDVTAKTNIRKPSARALREFLEPGEHGGAFYEYRDTEKPGRRPGRNFGPMAQDLRRSEIGRTLVATDGDGTLRVDAARLALADHSAMTHLASRLARLERRAAGAKGGRRGR